MANINLTIDMITRESLRVLHQKCNFISNVTTGYDDSFAVEGAKIGSTVRIRQPIQYSTGTGATIATGTGADSVGASSTLTVSTQRHVPMRFTSAEMTMSIDDFSERHVKPAMSKLAAMMENDVYNLYKYVPNVSVGTKVDFGAVMGGRQELVNNLAPPDNRYAILDPQGNVDLVTDNKSLFNDSASLGKTFKEGGMGRFGGFDFYENSISPVHTTGAEGGGSAYLVNGANQDKDITATSPDPTIGALIVDTGTKTIKAGDVFTIGDDVFDVHPETKVSTGVLKKFTVTADATGAGTLAISPAIIVSGPHQNTSAIPDNDDKLTFLGAASTAYKQSLLFQKGFAVMGTADLVLPPKQEATRQVYDGISMRLVKDYYDGVKDRLYTRLDVLYGFKILRPDLAFRIMHT